MTQTYEDGVQEVVVSGLIDADADRTWAALRDFSGLHNFAHDVVSSEIEDGWPADRIGAVRRIVLTSGGVARERLLGLSDLERQLHYTLVTPGPFPLETYSERLRVIPVTDGDRALVEMTGAFRAPPGGSERSRVMIRGMYEAALVGMRAWLGGETQGAAPEGQPPIPART